MTWEQRMAERAHARKAAADAAARVSEPSRNALDEATIDAEVPRWTPEAIAEWRATPPTGCACPGGPPGCTLCYCHLRIEAIARAEGKPCPRPMCN